MPETYKDKLKRLVDWTNEPELTEADLDQLLAENKIADSFGRSPEDEDWVETYDLYKAAAAGWLLKAARKANTTETNPDSLEITSHVLDNCLKLADEMRKRGLASVRITKF
jgi:hypothetical protein